MSISELTEIISPAFTEEIVLKILTVKSGLSDFKILEIVIEDGQSKKGDSYLSSICRFKVTASGKNSIGELEELTVPVLVKFIPKNIARQKTFRSADFFKTEIYFYEKVWPEMRNFKLSKIADEPDEVPLFLAAHCDGKNDFVALEDLSYQGFAAPSRSDAVTKERLCLLLKVLANFHALGIVAKLNDPEFEKKAINIPESYYAEKFLPWYENFMYKSMGVVYKKAAKEVLPKQEYYDKVTKLFSGDYFGKVMECCNVRDKFSTVTEGDAWLPNYLVRSDNDGKQVDALIIDFQLARYAPLVNDLFHFLLTSVPKQMIHEWDNLIAEYHRYLSSRIELLGGDKNFITLQEIHDEFLRYPFVGLGMAMESFIMSQLTDNEVADIDMLGGEEAHPLENVWILPDFDIARKEKFAALVKHCVDKGFIS